MKQLLFNGFSILQKAFAGINSKSKSKGTVLLVEPSIGAMQRISDELAEYGLDTFRIGNADAIINYHQKNKFDLILVHFSYAYKLRAIYKKACEPFPIYLIFDDPLKDKPHIIVEHLLTSGCKQYLLSPLNPARIMDLVTKNRCKYPTTLVPNLI
jgi:response regulator RpfG family c-di-GMP phosphodiesterase